MFRARVRHKYGAGERHANGDFLPVFLNDDRTPREPLEASDEFPLDDAKANQLGPSFALWNVNNYKPASLGYLMQGYGRRFHI
jgi:hypothetical protein